MDIISIGLAMTGLGHLFKQENPKLEPKLEPKTVCIKDPINSQTGLKIEDIYRNNEMYFNTISLNRSVKKIPNNCWNPNLIFNDLPTMNDVAKFKSLNDIPLVVTNLNSDEGNVGVVHKHEKSIVSAQMYTDRPESYAVVGSSDHAESNPNAKNLTHNNMVPFYGSKIKQNIELDNRKCDGKLEAFTGNFKLNLQSKHENGPLFEPTTGMTNINGTVVSEDRQLDRYVPSVLGKKNNEAPCESVHVGPGLNDGYTAKPSGGYHNPLRIMPIAPDQLFINPKTESKGKILPGKSLTENRTMIPQMHKNRPELLVENKNGERNFITTGAFTARRSRPTIIVRDTNRKSARKIIGNALGPSRQRQISKTQISRKNNLKSTGIRNIVQSEGKKHGDYGKSGFTNRPNERVSTGVVSQLLNLTTYVKQGMSSLFDNARKTRKQDTIQNLRQSGNTKPQMPTAPQNYPLDIAKTTIREDTENFDHRGVATGTTKSIVYDPEAVAKTTIKEQTEYTNYQGTLTGEHKSIVYDPNNITKTTIREQTENSDYVGTAVSNQKSKLVPTDLSRTTIREQTENTDYIGTAVSNIRSKLAPTDVSKTTVRETLEVINHKGVAKSLPKGVVYDQNNVTRTTIREQTENTDYKGTAHTVNKSKIYNDDTAKTTIREQIENTDYVGTAKANTGKKIYNTDVAKTTIKEQHIYNNYKGTAKNASGQQVYINDNAKTTIKEQTEKGDYIGTAKSNTKQKNYAFDVAKTTIKEQTENNDYKGTIKTNVSKSKVYLDDVAKTTVKETTINTDHRGVATGQKAQKTYDSNDVAKTTIKEQTEKMDRRGVAYSNIKQKAHDPNDIAKNTTRQFTGDHEYVGVGDAKGKRARLYDDAYNAELNVNKEIISRGRKPAGSSVKVTKGVSQINMEVKKLEEDILSGARRSQIKTSNTGDRFTPTVNTIYTLTSEKNNLPEEDTRLDSKLLDAYRRNPLTQSLNSYA